jgi:hypothetical protein
LDSLNFYKAALSLPILHRLAEFVLHRTCNRKYEINQRPAVLTTSSVKQIEGGKLADIR